MKTQLFILKIVLILVIIGFSGCNRLSNSYLTEKNKFVGTWMYLVPSGTGSNYSFTYHFFSNGTFCFNKSGLITNGIYDLIDGNLWFITNANDKKNYDDCVYMFSENNTKLTIEGYTYIKQ